MDPGAPVACTNPAQPIRRLSRSEYERTVRDLFEGATVPETFTFATDETLGGFTNNYSALNPSALLIEQYYDAALAIVKSVAPDLDALLPCDSAGGMACAEEFIRDFGRRAYRRPLTDEEVTELRGAFESGPGSTDFTVGAQLAMMAILQSPSFLYRPEFGVEGSANPALSAFETASRLSYFIWGTMPDDELLDKAQGLELTTSEQIGAQAQRMLESAKAKEGMLHFHREWLKVSQLDRVSKKEEDNYDVATRNAIKESLDRFVWDTLFVKGGSALDLLTAESFPANQRVAALLGAAPVAAGVWQDVNVAGSHRAGILTHPAFLASHAYANYPSPVLRGVFVLDRILCAPPSPPPADVNATPPEATSGPTPVTNRERYADTTKEARCMGCHTSINGIGFAFENFDTMGRYIETDGGKAIDATGEALGLSYQNATELGTALAGTDQYRSCVVDKWLNYALGGSPLAQDRCLRDELSKSFAEHDFNVKELVLAIAVNPKFSQSFVKGEQ